jgi:hypothetical protein
VGKTVVYSAGIPIFAAFPKSCRFLTEGAVLLVHERRLEKSLDLKGPLKSCIQIVTEQLHMLKTAERQEMEGFRQRQQDRGGGTLPSRHRELLHHGPAGAGAGAHRGYPRLV